MRSRIVLPIFAALIAYAAYMCSLPVVKSGDAGRVASSSRITREITLDAECVYVACLGEYADARIARAEAARHAARGAAACVREGDGTYAVLAASYDTDGAAKSVCARISENEGISANVRVYDASAVRLRVTADEGQLSAVESALNVIKSCPETLSALAYRLDGGETDTATARSLASITKSEVSSVRLMLDANLSGTGNDFCLGVAALIENMDVALGEACASDGPSGLALSSYLKEICLETRLGMIDLMTHLA